MALRPLFHWGYYSSPFTKPRLTLPYSDWLLHLIPRQFPRSGAPILSPLHFLKSLWNLGSLLVWMHRIHTIAASLLCPMFVSAPMVAAASSPRPHSPPCSQLSGPPLPLFPAPAEAKSWRPHFRAPRLETFQTFCAASVFWRNLMFIKLSISNGSHFRRHHSCRIIAKTIPAQTGGICILYSNSLFRFRGSILRFIALSYPSFYRPSLISFPPRFYFVTPYHSYIFFCPFTT